MLRIPDVELNANKRTRLWAALMTKQQADQAINIVIRFITEAMLPGRYVQDRGRFDALPDGLAEALSLLGLRVSDQGKVAKAPAATTHEQIARLAGRLRTELERREVHPEVVRY